MSLVGYCSWGHKKLDTTEWLSTYLLFNPYTLASDLSILSKWLLPLVLQVIFFLSLITPKELFTWCFKGTELLPFPDGSSSKKSACNAGDPCSIPGLGRSPGEGNGYPLQYSSLENSMDRGAWKAIVHGVSKSWSWATNTFHFLKGSLPYPEVCWFLFFLYFILNSPPISFHSDLSAFSLNSFFPW